MSKLFLCVISLICLLSSLQGQVRFPSELAEGGQGLLKPIKGAQKQWERVEKAAVADPVRAGALLIEIFEGLGKDSASGEAARVKLASESDKWLESFVAFWLSSEEVSIPGKVIVLDALYRSPVSKRFSSLGFSFRTHTQVYFQFAKELEMASSAKPTPFSAVISKWSKGLNENQNATLAALVSRPISGNWQASEKNVAPSTEWIEKTLRGRSEVLADVALPMVTFRAFRKRNRNFGNLLDEARAGLSRLPAHPEFTPLLRLEIMDAWVQSGHASKAFASAGHFDLIRDGLNKTSDSWRDRSRCPILDSTKVLSGMSFDKMQEPAAKLVTAFTKTRYAENDRMASDPDRLSLSKLNLGKLAVAAGEMDFVVEVIEEAPDYFRSDLKLMLKLASKGHAKIAATLASPEPEDYDRFTGIWFTAEDAANLKLLVPALPKESAYLVECVIASSQDHLDTPPAKDKISQRLIPLAKRYAAEAPKDDRSRFLLLQGFGRSLGASTLLKAEYERLLESYDFGDVLSMREDSRAGSLDSVRLMECLAFAYGFQLAEGNPEPIRKEFKRLCGEPEYKWQAAGVVHHIFPFISTHALLHGAKGPAEASELTGFCSELFQKSFSLPGSDRFVTGNSAGLAMTMYVLAGKSQEWDALVQSLPKRDRDTYSKIRKRGSVRQMFGLVGGTLPFYHGDYAEMQQAVTDALLNDEWIYKREIKSIKQLWDFVSVFRAREEAINTVGKLPESHGNRAEYLAAIAAYYTVAPLKNLDKYDQAMSKARKIAEGEGDFKSVNRYVDHHSHYLAKNQRYEEAIKVLKMIKRDILNDDQKKQVDASLKKWEAAK